MELLKKLTDPRQNATINLALEMIDLETEGLRSQRFSEQQIEKRISQHIPFFSAKLVLNYLITHHWPAYYQQLISNT